MRVPDEALSYFFGEYARKRFSGRNGTKPVDVAAGSRDVLSHQKTRPGQATEEEANDNDRRGERNFSQAVQEERRKDDRRKGPQNVWLDTRTTPSRREIPGVPTIDVEA